jgi:methionyl-tRNA formyltransferase
MKKALLTTETSHHAFFAQQTGSSSGWDLIVSETDSVKPKFPVEHSFEKRRDEFEWRDFFSGERRYLLEFGEVLETPNVNSPAVMQALKVFNPDVVIVFGTRKLDRELLQWGSGRLFNLHGGDPRQYRGLDSHLWACYHRDFSNLVTCLHEVAADLDTGAIVDVAAIPVSKNMDISELRASNTRVCIQLTERLLVDAGQGKSTRTTAQNGYGRYYSFMPSVLKEIAADNFNRFTRSLP